MLRKVLIVLLCGFAIAGQMRAQEVMVARETKPNTSEQPAPAPERSDVESENIDRSETGSSQKEVAFRCAYGRANANGGSACCGATK